MRWSMKSHVSWVGLATLLLVGACTNTHIDETIQLDPYQKTISVPAVNGKLADDVTEIFKQNSWQIGTNTQPLPNARYGLQLSYTESQLCMPRFDPMYDYDITIIDSQHGTHVFNMHGRDCQHTILAHLDDYLKGKRP